MNDNLISALRNMVDDIESLGAAPQTVDVNLLKQAIAALTPAEGYVLVQRAPLVEMLDAGWDALAEGGGADFVETDDLAAAWSAMLDWCVKHPGSAP